MVPQVLSHNSTMKTVDICTGLVERIAKGPDFLNNVVTVDESRVFQYDFETKRQILQWTTDTFPRSKKARMTCSKVKKTLSTLCRHTGIVGHEYLPGGKRSTNYYTKMLWSA
ncbi:hypothetical protein Cfor_12090 [Coptotermes formosanus]|uniref:Uncharacterized protein n=1 Tax=Coptotermes formosanus TaxID=36987 RepID=A0A6L2PRH4_COPFO|nr:hypothetical protein Cfor_12090 [Coptotermes formosanus]